MVGKSLRRRIAGILLLLTLFPFESTAEPVTGSSDTNKSDVENAIVIGLPAETATSPSGPFEFLIASYNVQCRPFFDQPKEKLPKISPLLNRFDVVLIQECFTRHDLLWGEATFPNKIYFGSRANATKAIGSGLSILSRLPVREAVMEHFRDVGELQNRPASKGILMARLLLGDLMLDVYNTHMEAGATDAAHRAQMGQARQMVELVNKSSPPEHAVIVMGDFNIGPLRPGKGWQDYTPNHYSDERDMVARTAAFEVMRDGLELKDAADIVLGSVDDGIERLLYRDGTRCRMEPLSCTTDDTFRRPDGSRLSDGAPKVVRMRVTPLPGN